jgi:hypothetical protein
LFFVFHSFIAVFVPSASALPGSLDLSSGGAQHAGSRRRVENYNRIVDLLTHRPTKRFKYIQMTPEEVAKQRFLQHAALEFERLREEQRHEIEVRLLQQQVMEMKTKATQKDRLLEQLESCLGEMDRLLLSHNDRVPADDISRWRELTRKLFDEHEKNLL